MGPRTYIRGNFAGQMYQIHDIDASMGPRTYIRGNIENLAALCADCHGFNGAADLHPRKSVATTGPSVPVAVLQWGRGLTSAEMTVNQRTADVLQAASMGPRTYIRGNVKSAVALILIR